MAFFFSLDTTCKYFKANGPWEFSSFGKIYPDSAKGKIKILPISIRIWVRNLRAFSGVLSWLSFFLGNFLLWYRSRKDDISNQPHRDPKGDFSLGNSCYSYSNSTVTRELESLPEFEDIDTSELFSSKLRKKLQRVEGITLPKSSTSVTQ